MKPQFGQLFLHRKFAAITDHVFYKKFQVLRFRIKWNENAFVLILRYKKKILVLPELRVVERQCNNANLNDSGRE
jgi:hypothetical protein